MAIAVPIKDMKNTASFKHLVDENQEVIVTKNGYTAFHCVSPSQREAELCELAKARLINRIALGEQEITEGKFSDISDLDAEAKKRYGI